MFIQKSTAFPAAVSNPTAMRYIAGSSICMSTISSSSTMMHSICTSDTAKTSILQSQVAKNALANSSLAQTRSDAFSLSGVIGYVISYTATSNYYKYWAYGDPYAVESLAGYQITIDNYTDKFSGDHTSGIEYGGAHASSNEAIFFGQKLSVTHRKQNAFTYESGSEVDKKGGYVYPATTIRFITC